jgi:hypothetical protein
MRRSEASYMIASIESVLLMLPVTVVKHLLL